MLNTCHGEDGRYVGARGTATMHATRAAHTWAALSASCRIVVSSFSISAQRKLTISCTRRGAPVWAVTVWDHRSAIVTPECECAVPSSPVHALLCYQVTQQLLVRSAISDVGRHKVCRPPGRFYSLAPGRHYD
jgi:hypothetical protein